MTTHDMVRNSVIAGYGTSREVCRFLGISQQLATIYLRKLFQNGTCRRALEPPAVKGPMTYRYTMGAA